MLSPCQKGRCTLNTNGCKVLAIMVRNCVPNKRQGVQMKTGASKFVMQLSKQSKGFPAPAVLETLNVKPRFCLELQKIRCLGPPGEEIRDW
jgi:hypothetical protein